MCIPIHIYMLRDTSGHAPAKFGQLHLYPLADKPQCSKILAFGCKNFQLSRHVNPNKQQVLPPATPAVIVKAILVWCSCLRKFSRALSKKQHRWQCGCQT